MPERVNPVDPPDLGLLPTFRRLLRLWRAERRLGALGLSLAFVYTLISIAIPLLMQQAIDHAIVAHRQPLWPYILAIVGLARAALRRQLLAPLRDRAHRHPHRGADARAALPRLPALPARVLRPARDRPGALARDERPLPDPLLHRLGPRAGGAEPDDDRLGGHRARARQPAARALHRGRDAADHRARAALRAPRVAALARGAGSARAT